MAESKRCSVAPPLDVAARFASAISSSMPVLRSAEIITTGQPRLRESARTSILSPLFSTRSAMFRAATTGRPVSTTWSARYRLRSRLVASITWMTTSGSPPMR